MQFHQLIFSSLTFPLVISLMDKKSQTFLNLSFLIISIIIITRVRHAPCAGNLYLGLIPHPIRTLKLTGGSIQT
ncbi:hypothetical protein YC2023_082654 [Brassica napus]